MGLFRRKKNKEPVTYQVSEEQIQNLKESGVTVDIAIGYHGADEIKKHPGKEPVYFRAVKAALMALGYDETWVSGEAADALNRKYL